MHHQSSISGSDCPAEPGGQERLHPPGGHRPHRQQPCRPVPQQRQQPQQQQCCPACPISFSLGPCALICKDYDR